MTVAGELHGVSLGAQPVLGYTATIERVRNDELVGDISSGLGYVTLLTSFPPLLGAGGSLDAMPKDTPKQRLAKLVRAEQLLRASADSVAFVRGPLASLLSAGYVAAVAGLLIGVNFPNGGSGAFVMAAGGVVLGQGRLLLHPDGILHEWRRYRFQHPDAGCAAPTAPPAVAMRWDLAPTVLPEGGGLAFSLSF